MERSKVALSGAGLDHTELEMKYTILDTETTGLDPLQSTVIEIAIWTVEDGKVIDKWATKVKPSRQDLALAQKVALEKNGYAANPEAWAGAPSWLDIAPTVARKLRKTMPVGHAVHFDLAMIRACMERHQLEEWTPFRGLDTMALAIEHLSPLGLRSFSLDRIRQWFGWSLEGAHTAEQDVADCYRLFRLLHQAGPMTRARIRAGRWWRSKR